MGNQLSNTPPATINGTTDIPLYLLTYAPQYTIIHNISINQYIHTLLCNDTITNQYVIIKVYIYRTNNTADQYYELEHNTVEQYNLKYQQLNSTIQQYNNTKQNILSLLPTIKYQYDTNIINNTTNHSHNSNTNTTLHKDKLLLYVRQYISYNLTDRLVHVQPLLCYTDKLFIIYQLLCIIDQLHSINVIHGDITPNNILLTSYNYIYLSDISLYKSVHINSEHPTEFSTKLLNATGVTQQSQRKNHCYVAPERFNNTISQYTAGMDVFSVGCIIYEIITNQCLFTYITLLSYRDNKYDIRIMLNKIVDVDIRNMIHAMVELDTTKRHNIQYYIDMYSSTLFQHYDIVYDILQQCNVAQSIDDKINCIDQNIDTIMTSTKNNDELLQCFILLLCTSLRHTVLQQSRITAFNILCKLTTSMNDKQKLIICTPYLMNVISDNSPVALRCHAITTLSHILGTITHIQYNHRLLISNYVINGLSNLLYDNSSIVAITFVQQLHVFGTCAYSSLQYTLKQNTDYNNEYIILQNQLLQLLLNILTHTNKSIRRAILQTMSIICTIIGSELTCNNILPHTITIMNEHTDWLLRDELCDCISGLSVLVGKYAFNSYLLPCIEQLNLDPMELIIIKSLQILQQCIQLGLCDNSKLLQWCSRHSILLIHPSQSIRIACINTIVVIAAQFTDVQCIVLLIPLLYNKLTNKSIQSITYDILNESLIPPLTYDQLNDIENSKLQLDKSTIHTYKQYIQQCKLTRQYLSTSDSNQQRYTKFIDSIQVYDRKQVPKTNLLSKKTH